MKSIIISIAAVFVALTATAQQKVTISGGADLVSAYIWRGSYNAGASVQPSIGLNVGGFYVGAWGSTDFGGNGKKEVDLSVNYSIKGFTIGLTDYWWAGEGAYKYFHYANNKTSHLFEGNLSYTLPCEKFPLAISWNTIFAGADYGDDDKRDYSTYIELNYPFAIGSVDMKAKLGAAPWQSPAFLPADNNGFSVCNVAVSAQKTIKCNDRFSIPLFSELIFNPATEDIHIVFGVSLKF